MTALIAFVIVLAATRGVYAGPLLEELPEFMHVCAADHPQLAECIMDSVRTLTPIFAAGYAPMDLPRMSPFDLDDFVVSPKSSGLEMVVSNGKLYNINNVTVSNLKVVKHGYQYHFDLYFPYIHSAGEYKMKGQLLFMRLEGHGDSEGFYYGLTVKVRVKLDHKRNTDGIHVPVLKRLETKSQLKSGNLRLDNLIGGDATMSKAVNDAINANFDAITAELMPLIEVKFQQLLSEYTNKLFSHFSSEQLFPKMVLPN